MKHAPPFPSTAAANASHRLVRPWPRGASAAGLALTARVALPLAQAAAHTAKEAVSAASAPMKQPTPADAVMSLLKKRGKNTAPTSLVPGVSSVDREIAGAAGNIPARIYTPDSGARDLAKQAQAVAVSVDYRRAPEAKFPAAWDDGFAAYKGVEAIAATFKGDLKRLALAGESAGDNLALATAIAALDSGAQLPTYLLAVCPVGQTGNLDTASYKDSADAKPLNKAMVGLVRRQVAGQAGGQGRPVAGPGPRAARFVRPGRVLKVLRSPLAPGPAHPGGNIERWGSTRRVCDQPGQAGLERDAEVRSVRTTGWASAC